MEALPRHVAIHSSAHLGPVRAGHGQPFVRGHAPPWRIRESTLRGINGPVDRTSLDLYDDVISRSLTIQVDSQGCTMLGRGVFASCQDVVGARLIEMADAELYRAKRSGRNRVCAPASSRDAGTTDAHQAGCGGGRRRQPTATVKPGPDETDRYTTELPTERRLRGDDAATNRGVLGGDVDAGRYTVGFD